MTSRYENATNGMNFDRFAEELVSENTLVKLQAGFYTAKQLLRTKLGKKEDDHLLASDADFDTKLSSFYSNSRHHSRAARLRRASGDLGVLLSRQSRDEKEHVANVMKIVGETHIQAARARMLTLKPIVRIYHELDLFSDRAILDCMSTVEAAEKARLEYRGSLMWMKKQSEELDPEAAHQVDKFRTTQGVVRQNKEKLDKLKEDTLQKVDLLDEARGSVLFESTIEYMNAMHEYFDDAQKAYGGVLDDLQGIDSYEIDILKILNDPVGLAAEQEKNKQRKAKKNAANYAAVAGQKKTPETTQFANDLLELDDEKTAEQTADKTGTSGAFLEELEPSEEPELISLDAPQSWKDTRESLRPDSPLGFLATSANDEEDGGAADQLDPIASSSTSLRVGPLPPLPNFVDSPLPPRLDPPPSSSSGWMNKMRSTGLFFSLLEPSLHRSITAQELIRTPASEPKFMPSNLFDQPLEMTTAPANDDWANWLEFDPMKPSEQTPNAHQM
ncbi:Arfaptin domain containing protein [Aphelenchoides fujianensis]|nr:Arfaptin domain containing protein [Aphelenchoides fujianensis]